MSLEEELFGAIADGKKALVEQLLEQGAPIRAVDKHGFSVLHYAAGAKQLESPAITAFLIAQRADVNDVTKWGTTPLHVAAENGNTAVARVLIENGAHINATNYDRRTPLFSAVETNQTEMVELLLAMGSRIDTKDSCGETPLQTAERKGYNEIAAVLKPPQTLGKETKRLVASEAEGTLTLAKSPEQLVKEVMALVKQHRGDETCLAAALTDYFNAPARQARPAHPRVNPASGFSIEHD